MTDINWKKKIAFLGHKSCGSKKIDEAKKRKYYIVEGPQGRCGVEI